MAAFLLAPALYRCPPRRWSTDAVAALLELFDGTWIRTTFSDTLFSGSASTTTIEFHACAGITCSLAGLTIACSTGTTCGTTGTRRSSIGLSPVTCAADLGESASFKFGATMLFARFKFEKSVAGVNPVEVQLATPLRGIAFNRQSTICLFTASGLVGKWSLGLF